VGCPSCPEITLSDVGDELLAQLGGRRYPLGATFELTERCNLRCLHCYIKQPAGSPEAASRELMLPQVQVVLDKMADAGGMFLVLTGGEPLLRPDFPKIWRYAKGKGMLTTLFTNGTLLTPQIADLLAEYRPYAVEITLYGATAQTYERVTGIPGSYARCLRAIEMLLYRGIRLNLKSVVLRANRHEMDAMAGLAAQYGTPYRFDGVLWPRLDGGEAPFEQRLAPAEVIGLDEGHPERLAEWKRLGEQFAGVAVRNEYVYNCGAARRTYHVDSAGRMSACMMARRPAFDLVGGNFQEGWELLGAAIRAKRTLDTPCLTCTVGALCMQCPGWSQMAHGDDETPVDYVCEMGRLRASEIAASVLIGSDGDGMPIPAEAVPVTIAY